MKRRAGPDLGPGTPDEQAEAIISSALGVDVADHLTVVRRRRQALTQGRRFHRQPRHRVILLESALQEAERHLAVLQQRQACWQRDRTFERNLVERVLLMARVCDFRLDSARGLRAARAGVTASADQPSTTPEEVAGETTLDALTAYLRRRFPPVE